MTANTPHTPVTPHVRTVTQAQFAQRIRHAMNESAENLPAGMDEKLRAARRQALNVRKQTHASGFRAVYSQFADKWTVFSNRLAFVAPAVVLGVGLYAMSQSNADNYMQSVAEIDTQVLSQELPLDALLDKGFVRFVQVGE